MRKTCIIYIACLMLISFMFITPAACISNDSPPKTESGLSGELIALTKLIPKDNYYSSTFIDLQQMAEFHLPCTDKTNNHSNLINELGLSVEEVKYIVFNNTLGPVYFVGSFEKSGLPQKLADDSYYTQEEHLGLQYWHAGDDWIVLKEGLLIIDSGPFSDRDHLEKTIPVLLGESESLFDASIIRGALEKLPNSAQIQVLLNDDPKYEGIQIIILSMGKRDSDFHITYIAACDDEQYASQYLDQFQEEVPLDLMHIRGIETTIYQDGIYLIATMAASKHEFPLALELGMIEDEVAAMLEITKSEVLDSNYYNLDTWEEFQSVTVNNSATKLTDYVDESCFPLLREYDIASDGKVSPSS